MTTIYLLTGTDVIEIPATSDKIPAVQAYMDEIGAICLGEATWSIEGFDS